MSPHEPLPTADVAPMTPAELMMATEAMGWSRTDTCRILDVADRTMRYWLAAPGRIPVGVRRELEAAEAQTDRAVADLVAALRVQESPRVEVFRADEKLWAARPELRPWPARWWRVVAHRATREVDGVAVDWSEANEG